MSSQASEASLQRICEILDRMERDIYSYQSSAPGIALRLDRLERRLDQSYGVIKWAMSGSLLGLVGSSAMLFRIVRLLDGNGQ